MKAIVATVLGDAEHPANVKETADPSLALRMTIPYKACSLYSHFLF